MDGIAILLVEDSATSRQMVTFWLAGGLGIDHELTIGTTLRESLDACQSHSFDLIILDLNLPDSEGLDTFRAIRGATGNTPIVIMSGDAHDETALAALREGAEDYIVKSDTTGNPLARPLRFTLERSRRRRAEHDLRAAQHQMDLARAVQQDLFPEAGPDIPGVDICGRCEPADLVGGDYYDFFEISRGRWGLVLGDVCGHGVSASLVMVGVRAAIRALATSLGDAGSIVSRTNQVFNECLSDARFVTLMFVTLDPENGSFQYSSAGHPGFLFDAAGNLKVQFESPSPPIGVLEGENYCTSEPVALETGDTILIHTDGVTEASNACGAMFGSQRLFDVMRASRGMSAQETIDHIYDAVQDFTGGSSRADDITVVVIKYNR